MCFPDVISIAYHFHVSARNCGWNVLICVRMGWKHWSPVNNVSAFLRLETFVKPLSNPHFFLPKKLGPPWSWSNLGKRICGNKSSDFLSILQHDECWLLLKVIWVVSNAPASTCLRFDPEIFFFIAVHWSSQAVRCVKEVQNLSCDT